jgi:hypothetical protein
MPALTPYAATKLADAIRWGDAEKVRKIAQDAPYTEVRRVFRETSGAHRISYDRIDLGDLLIEDRCGRAHVR